MSDAGRKDLSTKIGEAVTPDSQKSYLQQAKETVTDGVDKVAAAVTPESQKGLGQSVADHVQKGHDDGKSAAANHASLGEQAGSYLQSAKEAVGGAAEYVSSTLAGAVHGGSAGADAAAKK